MLSCVGKHIQLCFCPDFQNLQNCFTTQNKNLGGPQTDKHLPQSPFTSQLFQITTFGIDFYQSNLSTSLISLCLLSLGWYRIGVLKYSQREVYSMYRIVSFVWRIRPPPSVFFCTTSANTKLWCGVHEHLYIRKMLSHDL